MHRRSHFGPHHFRHVQHECEWQDEPPSFRLDPRLEAEFEERLGLEVRRIIILRSARLIMLELIKGLLWISFVALTLAVAIYLLKS